MKQLLSLLIFLSATTLFAQFSTESDVVICDLENSTITGFIFPDINNGSITFSDETIESSPNFTWYRYYDPTIGLTNEMITQYESDTTSTTISAADLGEGGYKLEYNNTSGAQTKYIWITDYNKYKTDIDSIGVYENGSLFGISNNVCSNLILKTYFDANTINFYSPTGEMGEISKTRTVAYNDESSSTSSANYLQISAPYDDIQFEATVYDLFTNATSNKDTLISATFLRDSTYFAKAVKFDAINSSILVDSLATNEIEQESSGNIGGSAPS